MLGALDFLFLFQLLELRGQLLPLSWHLKTDLASSQWGGPCIGTLKNWVIKDKLKNVFSRRFVSISDLFAPTDLGTESQVSMNGQQPDCYVCV